MHGYIFKMFLWFFFLGQILTVPVPSKSLELPGIFSDGELLKSNEKFIKYLIPGYYEAEQSKKQTKLEIADILDQFQDDENFKKLLSHVEAGHAMKDLTFNIYDDSMRETTTALFRIFQYADANQLLLIRDWASENINSDMLEYAWLLVSLYRNDVNLKEYEPPYVSQPNYFINSETIVKALKLSAGNGFTNKNAENINQVYKEDNHFVINTNYSSWNFVPKGCEHGLEYFREDIGLNSYYYGQHLQYPFWMSNDELSGIDEKYAEHSYYVHQQLLARYNLEREHFRIKNISSDTNCYRDFNPYLLHSNGLSFPLRSSTVSEWNEDMARIKSIDIAIKECLSRGVIFMENGTRINLTEDNYIDLLSKLIRANYDGVKVAKTFKSFFGYGGSGYPVDRYNPAPSVLHYPQTTLRDPIYWELFQSLLKYFVKYASTLKPYNFSQYETNDFSIIDVTLSKITTYFDYFQFDISRLLYDNKYFENRSSYTIAARQKRLKHLPFTLNFTIDSKTDNYGLIKLFLGPECSKESCWMQHSMFYELDSFIYQFEKGLNSISWSPETSNKFSIDDYYNMELSNIKNNKYNMFKFPENLIIPMGLEGGMNMTIFAMVIPYFNLETDSDLSVKLPPGFPFHREAYMNENSNATNYIFNTIKIYHKKSSNDLKGMFSSNLK